MLKIPSKLSLTLSIILSVLFFAICIVGLCFVPTLTEILLETYSHFGGRHTISGMERTFIHAMALLIPMIVMLADGLLFALLLRVKKGLVFTPASVGFIRGVSWCCFCLGAVFGGLGFYFRLSLVVGIASAFLGLCLRVVKNVIEEATEIKSENDLTV